MVLKVQTDIKKTKELFLFQKATNILMKSGKQDQASFILNECLAMINQIQKKKKNITRVRNFSTHRANYLKELGFLLLPKQVYTDKINEEFKFIENPNPLDHKLGALEVVEQAINNVGPFLEVRKVRTSRSTKQVPAMIKKRRQQTLAIRWIVEAAQQRRKKSSSTFSKCLAIEFLEAYSKQGKARQKRNDMHKIAYANRAHLRSRWW